ncbi:hypothetical protein [uncultured Algimonas sp.]|uniref:hypothetical protein n=1 Tax=uncultured Algimonas sp. TaxID=1547920 RepID=UPI00260A1DC5|nr:hypothetical protein [uncultured Algimonas sp.]
MTIRHARPWFVSGLLVAAAIWHAPIALSQDPAADPSPSSAAQNQADDQDFPATLIDLPVVFGGRSYPSVPVRITTQALLEVSPLQLADSLDGALDPAVIAGLADVDTPFITVEDLAALSITASLDMATLSIVIEGPAAVSGPLDVTLQANAFSSGQAFIRPAELAAGITTEFSLTQNFSDTDRRSIGGRASGFLNVGGLDGTYVAYGGDFTIEGGNGDNFRRNRIVAFRDNPDKATRWSLGDVFTNLSPLTGATDMLGLSWSRDYSQLQPNRAIRPLGNRSFILDRPGEVSVFVNGQRVTRFAAPAGAVNLNDIPLVDISNNVRIVVEDELGERVLDDFRLATDIALLEDGLEEFDVAAGVVRDLTRPGFDYTDEWALAGRYRKGISSSVTAGANVYASRDAWLAGADGAFALLGGIAALEGAVSDSSASGNGYAATFGYRTDRFNQFGRGRSFDVRVEHQSRDFAPAGSLIGQQVEWDVTGAYRHDFTQKLTGFVSGSWRRDHDRSEGSLLASAGMSYRLSKTIVNGSVRFIDTEFEDADVGVFLSLTRKLGDRVSVGGSYDSLSGTATIEARKFQANRLGALSYDMIGRVSDDGSGLDARADYLANRWRGRAELRQGSAGGFLDGDTTGTLRVQTGLAFADGTFAIGRNPGSGFYAVRRHPSLGDAQAEVSSGTLDNVRARTSRLGPAVAPTLSPYRPEVIQIRVSDAPIGYDIGEGRYATLPGALSGFDIVVGDAAYRSRLVTLTYLGEPLSLVSGVLENQQTGERSTAFSNRSGRMIFTDLTPGSYRLDLPNEQLEYRFAISENSEAYIDMGTVELDR